MREVLHTLKSILAKRAQFRKDLLWITLIVLNKKSFDDSHLLSESIPPISRLGDRGGLCLRVADGEEKDFLLKIQDPYGTRLMNPADFHVGNTFSAVACRQTKRTGEVPKC